MLKWILSCAFVLISSAVWGVPNVIASPKAVGKASFSFYGFKLYSAVLYTEGGVAYTPKNPFVLELDYKRTVTQQQFIDATLSEMERIEGQIYDGAALQSEFAACFRDVSNGDMIAANNVGPSQVDFYLNGDLTCRLKYTGISSRFFAIWLSDKSRSPRLSRALRGE